MLRQRDTYFDVAVGRLKLREDLDTGDAELIAYRRAALEGVRASAYERARLDQPERIAELLHASMGVVGVVEKSRRLFLYKHVRIHLDDVQRLGAFVELEAVQDGVAAAPDDDPTLAWLMRALDLEARQPIATGYLELLTVGVPPRTAHVSKAIVNR